MNAHWFTYQPNQAIPTAWLLSLGAPLGSSSFVGSLSREMKFRGWVYIFSDWITGKEKIVSHADTQETDAELLEAQSIALKIAKGIKAAKDAPKTRRAQSVDYDSFNGFVPDAPLIGGLTPVFTPLTPSPLDGFFPEIQPDNGGF